MFGFLQGKAGIRPKEADFHKKAGKLLGMRDTAFANILEKHLCSKGPIERAEYLFLAHVIQDEAYHGLPLISKERLVQLLELEKDLYHLYTSGFPALHYLQWNLIRSCRTSDHRDIDVSEALETSISDAESRPDGTMLDFDPVARNLLALIEESDQIGDGAFLETISKYDGTLVTLGSRALFKERPTTQERGSNKRFEHLLTTSLSIVEKGEWFALSVTSICVGFSAALSVYTSTALVIPLCFRRFTSLTAKEYFADCRKTGRSRRI